MAHRKYLEGLTRSSVDISHYLYYEYCCYFATRHSGDGVLVVLLPRTKVESDPALHLPCLPAKFWTKTNIYLEPKKIKEY